MFAALGPTACGAESAARWQSSCCQPSSAAVLRPASAPHSYSLRNVAAKRYLGNHVSLSLSECVGGSQTEVVRRGGEEAVCQLWTAAWVRMTLHSSSEPFLQEAHTLVPTLWFSCWLMKLITSRQHTAVRRRACLGAPSRAWVQLSVHCLALCSTN